MYPPTVRVAQGLLLYGKQIADGTMSRERFLARIGVRYTSFRSAGEYIGARAADPGLRFFDSSKRGQLSFGPGAGLVIGVSVGSESVRGALVDANGRLYHQLSLEPVTEQFALSPAKLLDRIRSAAKQLLNAGSGDQALLVDNELPLLGVGVAWGAAMNRDLKPSGPAWRHHQWLIGNSLNERIAQQLDIPSDRSYAMRYSHAGALAVAWQQTRSTAYLQQSSPRLAVVIDLSESVSAGTIIVEAPQVSADAGLLSGFTRSILIGGRNLQAGEIAHIPIDPALISRINQTRLTGLGSLRPHRCSCADASVEAPPHLEALIGTAPLMRRLSIGSEQRVKLRDVIRAPDTPVTMRALEDVGEILASALAGPISMLDPSSITLIGTLACPVVQRTVAAALPELRATAASPDVRLLDDHLAPFAGVQGVALAMLRNRVYRRLDGLLGGTRTQVPLRVRDLTVTLRAPTNENRGHDARGETELRSRVSRDFGISIHDDGVMVVNGADHSEWRVALPPMYVNLLRLLMQRRHEEDTGSIDAQSWELRDIARELGIEPETVARYVRETNRTFKERAYERGQTIGDLVQVVKGDTNERRVLVAVDGVVVGGDSVAVR